jgi:hypothetical protein
MPARMKLYRVKVPSLELQPHPHITCQEYDIMSKSEEDAAIVALVTHRAKFNRLLPEPYPNTMYVEVVKKASATEEIVHRFPYLIKYLESYAHSLLTGKRW